MNVELEPVPGGWIVWHGSRLVGAVRQINAKEFQCSIKMLRDGKSVLQECGRTESKDEAVKLVAEQRRAYIRARPLKRSGAVLTVRMENPVTECARQALRELMK